MRHWQKGVVTALAVGAVVAVGIRDLPSLLAFLSGAILGVLTLSGLRALVVTITGSVKRSRKYLAVALHALRYPVILLVMYLLISRLHMDALFFALGYTLALIVFLVRVGLIRSVVTGMGNSK